MSRPVEYESGAPNVYQPQPAATPAYEEFPDPAAAHGWQTAYDATAERPRIGPAGPGSGDGEPSGPDSVGRAARRRAARGGGGRRSRRVVVAVGAAGAAALVVGLFLSGSSSESGRAPASGTASPSAETGGATDPASSALPEAPGRAASGGPASGVGTSDASPSVGASADPRTSGSPSARTSSSASPTPPASSAATGTDGPGNAGGKGRGQGSTKKPK